MYRKAERLSQETGCWLYISAQHLTANMGFVNYTSLRLRRDARRQVTDVQNQFHAIFTSLLQSRRTEAAQLILQAQKATEDLRKVEEDARKVRAELLQQEALVAEKDTYITQLQAQLLTATKVSV